MQQNFVNTGEIQNSASQNEFKCSNEGHANQGSLK